MKNSDESSQIAPRKMNNDTGANKNMFSLNFKLNGNGFNVNRLKNKTIKISLNPLEKRFKPNNIA